MTGEPPADGDRPPWWERNESLRERLGLPAYVPPRFADGTYVHGVRSTLEARYGCRIRILGVNVGYPDNLDVRVDGEVAFRIPRRRDDGGNTVYGLTAEAFRDRIAEHVGDDR